MRLDDCPECGNKLRWYCNDGINLLRLCGKMTIDAMCTYRDPQRYNIDDLFYQLEQVTADRDNTNLKLITRNDQLIERNNQLLVIIKERDELAQIKVCIEEAISAILTTYDEGRLLRHYNELLRAKCHSKDEPAEVVRPANCPSCGAEMTWWSEINKQGKPKCGSRVGEDGTMLYVTAHCYRKSVEIRSKTNETV